MEFTIWILHFLPRESSGYIRKVFFFPDLVDFKILQDPKNSLPGLPCASVVISCRSCRAEEFPRVDLHSRDVVPDFFCTWCPDRLIAGPYLYFCAIYSSFKAQICPHTICATDEVRCLFCSTYISYFHFWLNLPSQLWLYLMDNLLIGYHISSYAVRGKFVRVQRWKACISNS